MLLVSGAGAGERCAGVDSMPKSEPRRTDDELSSLRELEARFSALRAHIHIVEAKVLLAQRLGIRVPRAHTLLRAYAEEQELSLAEVGRRVVGDELNVEELMR